MPSCRPEPSILPTFPVTTRLLPKYWRWANGPKDTQQSPPPTGSMCRSSGVTPVTSQSANQLSYSVSASAMKHAKGYPLSHWENDGCSLCWALWRPYYFNHCTSECWGLSWFRRQDKLHERRRREKRKRQLQRRSPPVMVDAQTQTEPSPSPTQPSRAVKQSPEVRATPLTSPEPSFSTVGAAKPAAASRAVVSPPVLASPVVVVQDQHRGSASSLTRVRYRPLDRKLLVDPASLISAMRTCQRSHPCAEIQLIGLHPVRQEPVLLPGGEYSIPLVPHCTSGPRLTAARVGFIAERLNRAGLLPCLMIKPIP